MGKSLVTRRALRHLRGWMHIDDDQLVAQAYQLPHVQAQLAQLNPQLQVTKTALRAFAFAHIENLRALERLLHPEVARLRVRKISIARCQRRQGVLIETPLLFETQSQRRYHRIIAVSISAHRQAVRLVRRGYDSRATAMMKQQQLNDQLRVHYADVTIGNHTPVSTTVRHFLRAIK